MILLDGKKGKTNTIYLEIDHNYLNDNHLN